MQHKTLEQMQAVAEAKPNIARPVMSRTERLERWAALLEREPGRLLATLPGTEYQPVGTRETMRSAGSPITVAFEDVVFRAEGMKDDTYGEAKNFFDITDRQMHEIVCYCHYGATVSAATAARHVREAIGGGPGMFARLRGSFV
ncbi:hypothetical protein DUT91_20875 [Phyllobacterium salinisoli]|uniref:Uncharacterized protein n=1 Tax=Phyllobacterium salinisoli TaxID=1899321 RepID=A0A368K1Y5_9HYPH|nr:hypothetical protein [Phyllobacterium salinisoli]RCS22000.1 hypothetical protein DUT91_20875 [Phyllobacterium salinisoli]